MRIGGMSVVVAALVGCGGGAKQSTTPPEPIANRPPPPAEPPAEPAPPPAEPGAPLATEGPSDAEFEALMIKSLAMFDAMGAAADAAGSDCGKLAAGLDHVLDDNQEFMASARKWKGNADMDRRAEAWMKNHVDEIMPVMMKIVTAGQQCAADPAFAATMRRFDELK